MGVRKFVEKINDYQQRLENKTAKKIKKSDVEKVMRKHEAKRDELEAELKSASKKSKRERLKTKLKVVDEQIERATWLLNEIS